MKVPRWFLYLIGGCVALVAVSAIVEPLLPDDPNLNYAMRAYCTEAHRQDKYVANDSKERLNQISERAAVRIRIEHPNARPQCKDDEDWRCYSGLIADGMEHAQSKYHTNDINDVCSHYPDEAFPPQPE